MTSCFGCDADGRSAVLAETLVLVACGCNEIEEIAYCQQCMSELRFGEKITCWMCNEPLEMLAGPIPEGYLPGAL